MSVYLNVNVNLFTSEPIEHKIRTATPEEMTVLCNLLGGKHELLKQAADYVYANVNIPMGGEGTLYVRSEYQTNGSFLCSMNGSMRSCDHTDIPDVLDCLAKLFQEIGYNIIIGANIKIESTYDDRMFEFHWLLEEKKWIGREVETLNSKGE